MAATVPTITQHLNPKKVPVTGVFQFHIYVEELDYNIYFTLRPADKGWELRRYVKSRDCHTVIVQHPFPTQEAAALYVRNRVLCGQRFD